jgi:NAD(P)-dependent dehydrogenase (short-subunit alcohol dehydrogenase family)
MLLAGKTAIVYGGGGAIGGAVARAFAREGAAVHVAGRSAEPLDVVVKDVVAAGGTASAATLDVLDEPAVRAHADAVAADAGAIDVAVNAVGIMHVQGPRFADQTVDEFAQPIVDYTRAHFIAAQAVARHMVERGSGVLIPVSTPGSKLAIPGVLGFATACAAIEAMSRLLAAELGPSGVRVVCLRPDALPEAAAQGSHSRRVFEPVAAAHGMTVEEMLAQAGQASLLQRSATLAEVANTAVFLASDWAGAMTGTVANVTAGSLVD